MAAVQPYFWWVTPALRKASNPYTLMGDVNWTDYRVSADILLEQSGAVQLLGRVGDQSPADPSCRQSYHLQVTDQGNWAIVRELDRHVLGTANDPGYISGQIGFGVNGWINAQFDKLTITSPLALSRPARPM